MKKFLALLFLCYAVSAVKHSLKFFLTGTSGTTNFPEFAGVATVDGIEIGYCNSIKRKAEPKYDWMNQLFEKKPQYLQLFSQKCQINQHFFKFSIGDFKKRLNQSEEYHVLQSLTGCEWDDKSGEIKGFNQYGYDGEDFMALDLQAETWITPKPQAFVIKHLWNDDKGRIQGNKHLYMSTCPELLQDHINYGRTFLLRTERPSVSLLQKTPSSPVSCHATGFYPEKADLFWRKDGEEIHEGVEKGQILPNNDGTFQMSSELDVSFVKEEDWSRYDCVFQLYGLKEDIITTLDKAEIMTNWVSPSEYPIHHHAGKIAIGVTVGATIGVVLVFIGVYFRGRKRYDFLAVRDLSL
ncbi:major histocompatibility complex class I-related gene protein isoform X2 [Oryzias melastigma]|uniref:major histocompatibility complex class I-related gene protein isoform X2 n=1 Tax=Oryzias melastigma TaxID=30732 RepID=UPI000CF8138B|nr:major histocompatibility complex class I-related gene protein isoform X2 [Oryzias melastigma]